MSTERAGIRALALALAITVAGCGGGGTDNNPPPTTTVARAPTASGDGQTGTVGLALTSPLTVLVTSGGAPKSGVTVAWTASGAGAAITPASSVTDADGLAQAAWTLPHLAGNASASAAVSGAAGSPVAFHATASAGPASTIGIDAGNNQTGDVNTALSTSLSVRITDAFGNAVAGTAVTWAVLAGGGAVSPTGTTTGATGTAATTFTLGPAAGANQATASAGVLAGSPGTFSATGTVPVPTASVAVGNNFFNQPTTTITAGTKVIWTWTNTGTVSHSVQSTGSPSFQSSTIMSGNGSTYSVTFNTPGTYTYDCAVHGAAMSGTIVVQ